MKELAGENKTIIAPPFEHYLFTIHACATGVQNSLKRTGHLNRTPLSLFQVIIVATLAVMMVLLKGLVLSPCQPRAKGSNR